jgi:hypothetical protein
MQVCGRTSSVEDGAQKVGVRACQYCSSTLHSSHLEQLPSRHCCSTCLYLISALVARWLQMNVPQRQPLHQGTCDHSFSLPLHGPPHLPGYEQHHMQAVAQDPTTPALHVALHCILPLVHPSRTSSQTMLCCCPAGYCYFTADHKSAPRPPP